MGVLDIMCKGKIKIEVFCFSLIEVVLSCDFEVHTHTHTPFRRRKTWRPMRECSRIVSIRWTRPSFE